jgi:hypothetical protein
MELAVAVGGNWKVTAGKAVLMVLDTPGASYHIAGRAGNHAVKSLKTIVVTGGNQAGPIRPPHGACKPSESLLMLYTTQCMLVFDFVDRS